MIYADYNATWPCTRSHYRQVLEKLQNSDGNPSSLHVLGRKAKLALETSRKSVAELFSARDHNILFTSSATEANNIIIHSFLKKKALDNLTKILVSKVEHPSILNPVLRGVQDNLCHAYYCNVNHNCLLNIDHLEQLLTKNDIDLVCLIYVHNEVGSINPIREISSKIKQLSPKTHIHIDAVQALGKVDLNWLASSSVDSASFSAHKIGGFKGVGCLYLKNHRQDITPLISGGGQELGIRAGTENLPGIISFGIIAESITNSKLDVSISKLEKLKNNLVEKIKGYPNIIIHGDLNNIICNTINFHIKGIDVQKILIAFEQKDIAVSSKSACSSGINSPSYSLKAMGIDDQIASNSIRISLGVDNTANDIEQIASIITDHASK